MLTAFSPFLVGLITYYIVCVYPVSGLTGVGFDVPGATPGTGVGRLPDGSAVIGQGIRTAVSRLKCLIKLITSFIIS